MKEASQEYTVLDSSQNIQHEQYLESFYESSFSAYDFVCLYIAINVLEKCYSFKRDNLIDFIVYCKNNSLFDSILNDITIKNNGIYNYSEDLEEAIVSLKNGGLLYTISPEKDSTMWIFDNIPTEELMEKRKRYVGLMSVFISTYNEFLINNKLSTNRRLTLEKNKK